MSDINELLKTAKADVTAIYTEINESRKPPEEPAPSFTFRLPKLVQALLRQKPSAPALAPMPEIYLNADAESTYQSGDKSKTFWLKSDSSSHRNTVEIHFGPIDRCGVVINSITCPPFYGEGGLKTIASEEIPITDYTPQKLRASVQAAVARLEM